MKLKDINNEISKMLKDMIDEMNNIDDSLCDALNATSLDEAVANIEKAREKLFDFFNVEGKTD